MKIYTKVQYNPNNKQYDVFVKLSGCVVTAGSYPNEQDAITVAADLQEILNLGDE